MRTSFRLQVGALALSTLCLAGSSFAQSPKLPNPAEAAASPRETAGQRLDRLRTEQGAPTPGTIPSTAPSPSTDLIAADPAEAPMPGLKRLSPDAKVWVDPAKKRVVLEGEIVLRQGQLELLACLKQTKEHEAIIACETQAYLVHAALLAIGATPGNPARFQPEFTPARGTEIDITIQWKTPDGKEKSVDAREWIKHVKTGKQLDYPWVFGGSGFWKDPMTGKQFYQAEDGDFICVSNFPTAMLDLPVESPQANAALMFEAFTERIPDVKTKVIMILTPKLAAADKKPGENKPATNNTGKAEAGKAPAPAQPVAQSQASSPTETEPAPAASTATPRRVMTTNRPAAQPARGPIRRIFRRP